MSISDAHRVAAVERLVGATLVVALPRTVLPSAGQCLGTTGPGGWSGDFLVADWDRRPERRVSRADWDRRPSGRREGRRGAATQPGNDATPQGTHKGCPYGHRGWEVSKKSPTGRHRHGRFGHHQVRRPGKKSGGWGSWVVYAFFPKPARRSAADLNPWSGSRRKLCCPAFPAQFPGGAYGG